MTEPSQYFKGRTVQEQMNEVIGYVDTRAAEVATDAIAADVAQVHQDMLDADADASAAAASAAAAAGTLANAVKKTGESSQSIAGDIAVSGTLSGGVVTGTVITAPAPVNNTDAATKKYVDDADALKLNITDVNTYAVGLTGNQGPIAGIKQFAKPPALALHESGSNNANGWRKIFVSPTFADLNEYAICVFKLAANTNSFGLFTAVARNGTLTNIVKRVGNYPVASVKMSIDSNNQVIIWANEYRTVGMLEMEVHAGSNTVSFTDSGTTAIFTEPATPDYTQVLTATE